jgi:hypothetical protein
LRSQQAAPWCRWLESKGVPPSDQAIILDLGLSEVELHLAPQRPGCQPRRRVPTIPAKDGRMRLRDRAVHNNTGRKIGRMIALNYSAERIADVLCLRLASVTDYLRRMTPDRKAELVRPRSRREQRALDRNLRRRELARQAAAERAVWAERDAGRDDEGCTAPATPVNTQVDQAAELVPAPEVPPPAPNPWDGPAAIFVGATPKLTAAQAAEVRAKRAAGWPVWELAHEYEVSGATITATVRGRTRVKADEPSESAPPPAVEPKTQAEHRRRAFRVAKGKKYKAPRSGSLYDDD